MFFNNCYLDILNTMAYCTSALCAVIAVIFGFIHFNKRLKFYFVQDNCKIIISFFNKGNIDCIIKDVLYSKDKKFLNKSYATIINNGINATINLNSLGDLNIIYFSVRDSFGRKYKLKYKIKKEDDNFVAIK